MDTLVIKIIINKTVLILNKTVAVDKYVNLAV